MPNCNTNILAGVRCPKCGYSGSFHIEALVTLLVTDDEADLASRDMEWDDSNITQCCGCGYRARMEKFTQGGETT